MSKPNIIYIPAHSTNTWSRNGQKIEYIVLHYVGAVSSAKNNAEYLHRDSNLGWSAHYFTDEVSIYQSVALSLSAGHCGVDYSGGNAPFWGKCRCKNSIGIEMCCKRDSNGNWFIEPKTVDNTVTLVRWLMAEYGIDSNHILRHYDVCWKQCPEPWVRNPSLWNDFKKRISEGVYELNMTEKELDARIRKIANEVQYGDIKDVPDYWEGQIQELLDMKLINGGTDDDVNDHDVNLTRTEAKVLYLMVRLSDEKEKKMKEYIDAQINDVKKLIKGGGK